MIKTELDQAVEDFLAAVKKREEAGMPIERKPEPDDSVPPDAVTKIKRLLKKKHSI